jgi:uncharacterized membrane protein
MGFPRKVRSQLGSHRAVQATENPAGRQGIQSRRSAPDPGESMHKNRLEAFSDGVLAIILTIMVLEMKVPHGDASPAAMAYFVLSRALVRLHGEDSTLARAVGRDRKGLVSLLAYVAALLLAYPLTWGAVLLYVAVAVVWFIPDRRIERALAG